MEANTNPLAQGNVGHIDNARVEDLYTAPTSAIRVGQNTRQWNNIITEEKNEHQRPWNAGRSLERHDMEDDMPERVPTNDFADEMSRYGRHKVPSRHSSTGSKNSKVKKRGGRQPGSHLTRDGTKLSLKPSASYSPHEMSVGLSPNGSNLQCWSPLLPDVLSANSDRPSTSPSGQSDDAQFPSLGFQSQGGEHENPGFGSIGIGISPCP